MKQDTPNVHFLSKTNEWSTPQAIYDALDKEFSFTLDPCSDGTNAKCRKFYTLSDDGLSMSWSGEVVFMNPPYGREIGKWVKKAHDETAATVVCLIPSRTDTSYWHDYCMKANEIRFFRGRLRFGDASNSAPFPSCIVVFRDRRASGTPTVTSIDS